MPADSATTALHIATPSEARAEAIETARSTIAPRSLWRQPALLLSLAYLCTSAIGLWANYWYYRPFGVNILQFMQVSDFLAAGLQDPAYVGLVIGGCALSWLASWPDRWRGAERWRKHWWGRLLIPRWHVGLLRRFGLDASRTGAVLGVAWMAMWLIMGYVQNRAKQVLDGEGRRVGVAAAAETLKGLCADPRLIGTTSLYVFIYCADPAGVEVLPLESIGRISLAMPQKTPVENAAN